MKNPRRSAAIARALAAEPDGLPADFAVQVAAIAEAEASTPSSRGSEWALASGFVAMLGVCVAGGLFFGAQPSAGLEWLSPLIDAAASQPWLVVGVAGVAIVQALTFRRRWSRNVRAG